MAQCLSWLASIIGFQQGLIIHIDTLLKRTEGGFERGNAISRLSSPIDRSENQRSSYNHVHPERFSQLTENSDIGDSEQEKIDSIIRATNQVIGQSRNDWQAIESQQHPSTQVDPLCWMRQGKSLPRKLSKKERKSLNQISEVSPDQIRDILWNRIWGRSKYLYLGHWDPPNSIINQDYMLLGILYNRCKKKSSRLPKG